MTNAKKIFVAQLGARGHYSVPRALHQASQLAHFCTDIIADDQWLKPLQVIPQRWLPSIVTRLKNRDPIGVPRSMISTYSQFAIEYLWRLRRAHSAADTVRTYLWAGKKFGKLVLNTGLRGSGVYVYNTAGLDILRQAKAQGMTTILEQTIAPYQFEHQLLIEEQRRYPDWEEAIQTNPYQQEIASANRKNGSLPT